MMAGLNLGPIAGLMQKLVMLDTLRLTRPGGEPVFDPVTGQYTRPEGNVYYEGPGAVVPAGEYGNENPPVAGQPWPDETRSPYKVFTPLDGPVPERDDVVEVIEVHPGGDASLLARQWRCQDPGRGSSLPVLRITFADQMQQSREVT